MRAFWRRSLLGKAIAEDRTCLRRLFTEALPLRHSEGIKPYFHSAFSNCGSARGRQATVDAHCRCAMPRRKPIGCAYRIAIQIPPLRKRLAGVLLRVRNNTAQTNEKIICSVWLTSSERQIGYSLSASCSSAAYLSFRQSRLCLPSNGNYLKCSLATTTTLKVF